MILFLLVTALSAQSLDTPCKQRTDLKGACFRVRGSLRLYNGTPSARIYVTGTKRVFGVIPAITNWNETFAAPPNVVSASSFDHSIEGEFLVCPLSAGRPHEMRYVCIESATLNSKHQHGSK